MEILRDVPIDRGKWGLWESVGPNLDRREPDEMMTISATCKVCGCAIRPDVSKSFAAIEDEWKEKLWSMMIAGACCDFCADTRDEYISSRAQIIRSAQILVSDMVSDATKGRVATGLDRLVRKYAEAVRKIHGQITLVWQPEYSRMIVDKPENVWSFFSTFESKYVAQAEKLDRARAERSYVNDNV